MAPYPLFAGVTFALHGFDQVSASKYRLEIEGRGGVHVGGWDGDCTHVIVSNTLYDDPVCVAARKAGKKVVVDQWVDDSLQLRALAYADQVLYAPLRDFKGIPGCDKLHICLTGYHKNWRNDIMKMVTLMGANFSKSLAANRDTHLICYKFEGEKYERAKKVNIKLVNHRWLEECLKAWDILPVDHFAKSGWEVEIMEAEVKDSEDEAEDAGRGLSSSRRIGRTPIREIRSKSHVDSAIHAPSGGPTINVVGATGKDLGTPKQRQTMKADNTSTKSPDIRADSGSAPDTNCAPISLDHGSIKSTQSHTYHSENDEAPADVANRDEAKGDHRRELDTRATLPCFHGSSQINVNNDLHSISSEENFSKKVLHSKDLSRKVDQKEDGHASDPKTNISQSSVEENLNTCRFNPRSEGNSASRNDPTLGYSRRRPLKAVSPKVTTSDRSGGGLALRRKSILSSVSSKPPNEAPDLGSGIASSPFSGKEMEAAASNVGRSPTESTKVDGHVNSGPTMNSTKKQISRGKGHLLSHRRTSLKRVSSAEVEKLPENSANDKNMEAPVVVKTPAPHEATAEEHCKIAPHCPEEDADTHLFAGVRFVLHGFDQVSASQYRLEIERCGGVHVGGWDGDCTHVIVSNTLYDDPVCVTARKAGKKVIVDLWVDDSLELGALADADRVLYAPLRDFKGIPGCDKLHICLTGYHNWRDDIMKMVNLMGGNFYKSLDASRITHLICYKFEGEKYELAKKANIKLVNHRWLEECLKAWEILPVDHFARSGWEVEIMEAQAKDEAEDAGKASSSSRRIGRRTPVREIRSKSHVDSAIHAPSGGPTISASSVVGATRKDLGAPEQRQTMEADDTSTKSPDIRADSGIAPDTKCAGRPRTYNKEIKLWNEDATTLFVRICYEEFSKGNIEAGTTRLSEEVCEMLFEKLKGKKGKKCSIAQIQTKWGALRKLHTFWYDKVVFAKVKIKDDKFWSDILRGRRHLEYKNLRKGPPKDVEFLDILFGKKSPQKSTPFRKEIKDLKEERATLQSELKIKADEIGLLKQQLADNERLKEDEIKLLKEQLAIKECQFQDGERLRKTLYNKIVELKGSMRVFVRVRPFLKGSEESSHISYPKSAELLGRGINITKEGQVYQFQYDKVFGPQSTQEDVFEEVVELVECSINGYKVCIFTSGQTGSGKSYTMIGKNDKEGVIPRSLKKIFGSLDSQKGWRYIVNVSAFEIYLNELYDLLAPNHNKIQGTAKLIKAVVVDTASAMTYLEKALKKRSVRSTCMNDNSSRSHFVFELKIYGSNEEIGQSVEGYLNFIDLAGNEKNKRSCSEGISLVEASAINVSLMELNKVFTKIANNDEHIPFRNSKLTSVLKPYLVDGPKTLMVVNIAPDVSSIDETIFSLEYAKEAKDCIIGKPTKVSHLKPAPKKVLPPPRLKESIATTSRQSTLPKVPSSAITYKQRAARLLPPTTPHALVV